MSLVRLHADNLNKEYLNNRVYVFNSNIFHLFRSSASGKYNLNFNFLQILMMILNFTA